jgi:hypothetical protein
MVSFRWDTLVVVALVGLMVGYLVLQAGLRTNFARLLGLFRLARRNAGGEPNLGDRTVEHPSPLNEPKSRRRRIS